MPNALPYPLHYPIMLCTTVWNYASHFTPESCTQFLPLITLFTPVTACACHLHPPVRDAIPRAKPSASRTGDLVVCVS
jgi:hypothetical protein